MNIIYSSSDSYIKYTSISICSLFENNRELEIINVTILSTDIKEDSARILHKLSKKYNRQIRILDVSKQIREYLKDCNLPPFRGGFEVYSTLFLSRLFPELDRAIYIDADTLVLGSLKSLWEKSLEENVIGAVPDYGNYGLYSSSEDKSLLNQDGHYYNSGFLIYDFNNWRSQKIDNLIDTNIRLESLNFLIFDQSIINCFLKGKILTLPMKFNLTTSLHGISFKTFKKVFQLKDIEFDSAYFYENTRNVIVVHFVGQYFERPWINNGYSPYKDIYLNYSKLAGFKNIITSASPNAIFPFNVADKVSILLRRFNFYNVYARFRYHYSQLIYRFIKIFIPNLKR
ncbi:glycosyltransferase family 8 protein [Gammaproteobacteria bacterium]|nr:glycosyltransferase family 8 protein [Gammaproteobacteria bacterium]